MFCVASMYVWGCHWCMIFHEANIRISYSWEITITNKMKPERKFIKQRLNLDLNQSIFLVGENGCETLFYSKLCIQTLNSNFNRNHFKHGWILCPFYKDWMFNLPSCVTDPWFVLQTAWVHICRKMISITMYMSLYPVNNDMGLSVNLVSTFTP